MAEAAQAALTVSPAAPVAARRFGGVGVGGGGGAGGGGGGGGGGGFGGGGGDLAAVAASAAAALRPRWLGGGYDISHPTGGADGRCDLQPHRHSHLLNVTATGNSANGGAGSPDCNTPCNASGLGACCSTSTAA
jgi:hypothetical protein